MERLKEIPMPALQVVDPSNNLPFHRFGEKIEVDDVDALLSRDLGFLAIVDK